MIRGEERPFTEMLAGAVGDGMRLHYLDRATYRRKMSLDVLAGLRDQFGEYYVIPEGGGAPGALAGCAELIADFEQRHGLPLDRIYVAKAMLGLTTMVAQGEISPGTTVVFVLTGPAAVPRNRFRAAVDKLARTAPRSTR